MRTRTLAVCLATAASVSIAGESDNPWKRLSPERRRIDLVHQLETMSIATRAAVLIRRGKTEQALRNLDEVLASSAEAADQLTQAGARLPTDMPMPNLAAIPVRAQKYAAENGFPKVAAHATAVAERLK